MQSGESKRNQTHKRMTHGWYEAHYTLSQCHVRHWYEYRETWENVSCEGVLFTHPVGCSRLPSAVNDLGTTNEKILWAPPVFIPLPPWGTGRRRRRMPSLILLKRNRFCTLFSWFSVETVHYCDCFSEVWSESHRCILARFVQREIPMFLISFILLIG